VNLLRQSKCTEHVGEVTVDRRRVWTRTVRVAADDETVRCSADDGQKLCQFVVETTDGSTRRSIDVGDGDSRYVTRTSWYSNVVPRSRDGLAGRGAVLRAQFPRGRVTGCEYGSHKNSKFVMHGYPAAFATTRRCLRFLVIAHRFKSAQRHIFFILYTKKLRCRSYPPGPFYYGRPMK